MNIPGFVAGTSLYQTNNHYRVAAGGSFPSDGKTTVTPQGCGLLELGTCLGQIGVCIPLVGAACASDPFSCSAAWAICMGSSYAVCKDCIDNIIEGGEGGGGVGGTPHPCCPPGTRCCGGCTKVPGQGLFCEGDCIGLGEECT